MAVCAIEVSREWTFKSTTTHSASGWTKSISRTGDLVGGMRDLIVKHEMVSSARMMNAQVLMVHPYPMSSTRRLIAIGNIMPPRLEPHAAIPNAAARFFMNQVARQAKLG